MPDDKPHRRRKTAKKVAQPLPAIEPPKSKRQEPKPASPLKLMNIAEQQAKDKCQQKVHTNFVHNVLGKFSLYTSAKTIPVSVSSEHKNQVDTFQRNFAKVADPMASLYKSGYATEDDKNLIRFGASKKVKQSELAQSTTQHDTQQQARSEKSTRLNRIDIKEVLEQYAEL